MKRIRLLSGIGVTLIALALAGCPAAAPIGTPGVAPSTPTPEPTAVPAPATPEPIAAWAARHEGVTLAVAEVPRADVAEAPPEDIAELAAGINGFACDLHRALSSGEDNLIFSPYSISQALAMTYAGARSETAQQMARALGFTLPQERLHPAFNALDARLMSGQPTASEDFEISIANALWSQRGRRFLPEFLEILGRNYGTGMLQLDFKADPAAAKNTINRWASDRTAGRIPAVVGSLSGQEQLILTNAVYFNGRWASPFDAAQTEEETFYLLDGSSVLVSMMFHYFPFDYAAGEGYQAIALPYWGRGAAMLIILPAPGQFRAIEAQLSGPWLRDIQKQLRWQQVRLWMPRFGFETPAISLPEQLTSLGMVDAFACDQPGVPDFSGMDGSGELCISDVRHKAFIDVNETRTEAGAVTVEGIKEVSTGPTPEPVDMRIDRPFLFCIYDVDSGSILFMGRVMNPTAG